LLKLWINYAGYNLLRFLSFWLQVDGEWVGRITGVSADEVEVGDRSHVA